MQFFARWGRFAAAILFVAFGVWVISILATPTRTTTSVQDSVAALAPGRSGDGCRLFCEEIFSGKVK